MKTKLCRYVTFGLLLILSIESLILMTVWLGRLTALPLTKSQVSSETKYLLDSSLCKMSDIDPFQGFDLKLFKLAKPNIRCEGRPSPTYIEGSYLRFQRHVIKDVYNGDLGYCQYQSVARGPNNTDFDFVYGKLSPKLNDDILLPPEDEYLRVHCFDRSGTKISTNFHAAVTEKNKVEERSVLLFEKHKRKNKLLETFNVQMIGIGSVSRLNFKRKMPMTSDFILNDLNGFEMTGYNKVADNTIVNIIPLLTGKYAEETSWDQINNDQTFDGFGFIWKNFTQAGYRTLYAEDAPDKAMFHHLKAGFHTPPADYYNRPLALAMEREKSVWNGKRHCIVDRLETEYLLNYATDFSRVFKRKPHFGFTFIARLTNDSKQLVAAADPAYLGFLKRFQKEGHLNNTVLILFSDHGYRSGKDRETYLGKVEERSPALYFVFPPKFHEKYPNLVRNLRKNSKRLTTPFDVYETLKDILYFDGIEREADVRKRGISLFREIPKVRTCKHAQIPAHWCLCLEWKELTALSESTNRLGQSTVRLINNEISPYTYECSELTLENVTSIVQIKPYKEVIGFDNTFTGILKQIITLGSERETPSIYQLTFHTLPGHAQFEATVTFGRESEALQLVGEVSRINSYGNQSWCVNSSQMKKLCYCKT